jgi:hypothetical protein
MTPIITRPARLAPTMRRMSIPVTRPTNSTPSPRKNVPGAAFSAALLAASDTTPQMTGSTSRKITKPMNSRT